MKATSETYQDENAISLLDLMVEVADNLKLLVLGPVLIGSLALAVGYLLPQSFVSESILALPTSTQTPAQGAAVMVSPSVLDPVINSLKLTEGRSLQTSRLALIKNVDATVGKDGLVRLNVTASTPVMAQTIANAVIDTWLKTTIPPARDREDLEARLAYAKVALAAARGLLARLTSEGVSDLSKSLTRAEMGVSLVAAGELQARYFSDVLTIPRTLQGLSRDVVVQPPTLPTESVRPRKGLIAVSAWLGSAVVLLLWVFMRQAWKLGALNPGDAMKQARFLSAMSLIRRSH